MVNHNKLEKTIDEIKNYREELKNFGITVKDLVWQKIELLEYQPFPHNQQMIEMIFGFTFDDFKKGHDILDYLYKIFMNYFKDLAQDFNIGENYVNRAYYYYNSSVREFQIIIRLPIETEEKFLQSVYQFLVQKLFGIVSHLYKNKKL